ncbi:hypothetical protein VL20_1044 [Microcystis panniformis FACHB-1757]|uniref:Uncharacterized protein n=1 Tax=Microcystis panniformis FACHB-1757 TaxID=1638788 RepID=A0A0K1RX08_9CHRO|nr:hypothetical protein VL20_1044 [Microcystis panniformis FACHB-1757]
MVSCVIRAGLAKKSLLFLSLWATIANISRSAGKMGLFA